MSKSYHVELLKALRDPQEAAEYLDAALEDGDPEAFFMALNNVAEAQNDISQFTEKTQFNQENIKKIFSKPDNSELYSFDALLHSLGFRLAIQRMP